MLANPTLGRQLLGSFAVLAALLLVLTLILVGHAASLRDAVEEARVVALEALPADSTADAAAVTLGQVSDEAQRSYRRAQNAAVGGAVVSALVALGLVAAAAGSRAAAAPTRGRDDHRRAS